MRGGSVVDVVSIVVAIIEVVVSNGGGADVVGGAVVGGDVGRGVAAFTVVAAVTTGFGLSTQHLMLAIVISQPRAFASVHCESMLPLLAC